MNLEKIIQQIGDITPQIIPFRRRMHQFPEVGYEEFETMDHIIDYLGTLPNVEIRPGIAKTGTVAVLRGRSPGKTLLIRADIDALPIREETNLPFTSNNDHMHACGHDMHTTIALGTCQYFSEHIGDLQGNLVFVFQPAEEANPTGGAEQMIEEGVLVDPPVDMAMALHVVNLPTGQVLLKPGIATAQSDRLNITVHGTSSHAAEPNRGNDAIVAAAQIITALQTVVSRSIPPLESAVITIGTIAGGSRYNVLCDRVELEGTVRIFNRSIQALMPEKIRAIAENIAIAFGCTANVEYVQGYRMVQNDPTLSQIALENMRRVLGDDQVICSEEPASGSEDFSAFTEQVPSVFYWLGAFNGIDPVILHNPKTVFDENAIAVGMLTLITNAMAFLEA